MNNALYREQKPRLHFFFDQIVRGPRAVSLISRPAMVGVGCVEELEFAGK